jgi:hypothetical protein
VREFRIGAACAVVVDGTKSANGRYAEIQHRIKHATQTFALRLAAVIFLSGESL